MHETANRRRIMIVSMCIGWQRQTRPSQIDNSPVFSESFSPGEQNSPSFAIVQSDRSFDGYIKLYQVISKCMMFIQKVLHKLAMPCGRSGASTAEAQSWADISPERKWTQKCNAQDVDKAMTPQVRKHQKANYCILHDHLFALPEANCQCPQQQMLESSSPKYRRRGTVHGESLGWK